MRSTGEILKKIRRLELRTRRLVESAFAGQYHSVFKGRGMNFDEVREYQPGDEIRTIDWNVTARTGRPHVKKFVEERELTVLLAVDLSGSGKYGSVHLSKRELSAEVASVLAFSAIRNNDKVGLLLFSDDVEHYIPPKKGRLHALRVIRDILYFDPKGLGTAPATALTFLNRVLTRRAVVFFLSDFICPDFSRDLAVTARRHDFVAIPVNDPCELELPDAGYVTFEDAETGQLIEINTSRHSKRDAFAEEMRKRSRQQQQLFGKFRIDSIPLRTDADYLVPLRRFFRMRERRIARG